MVPGLCVPILNLLWGEPGSERYVPRSNLSLELVVCVRWVCTLMCVDDLCRLQACVLCVPFSNLCLVCTLCGHINMYFIDGCMIYTYANYLV